MATIEDHSDVVFHANRTFVPERICHFDEVFLMILLMVEKWVTD